MKVVEGIQERFSARIVYGEPVERNGTVTIPAARVIGGGGGGSDKEGDEGGGFGIFATPIGAWVIEDGKTTWKPSVDMPLMVIGGYVVVIAFLYFRWRIERARSKSRAR